MRVRYFILIPILSLAFLESYAAKTKTTKTSSLDRFKKRILSNKDFKDYPPEYLENYSRHADLWSKITPKIFYGEEMVLKIDYFNINVAQIVIKTMPDILINSRRVHHISGELQSSSFYRKIYQIDDRVETFLDVKKFVPIRYTLTQRESKQNVDEHQLFHLNRLKTSFSYIRQKNGKTTKKKGQIFVPGHFQDFFSTFQFLRTLPLRAESSYAFPLVSRGKISTIKVGLLKRENISIDGKSYRAIKLQVSMRPWKTTKKKKKRPILIWLSDDETRKILRFDAHVKLGRVRGSLVGYKRPSPAK